MESVEHDFDSFWVEVGEIEGETEGGEFAVFFELGGFGKGGGGVEEGAEEDGRGY